MKYTLGGGQVVRREGWRLKRPTSRCQLCTLAGAAVVVSVLGAELGASVGEAAGPSRCAAEAFSMKTKFGRKRISAADIDIHC